MRPVQTIDTGGAVSLTKSNVGNFYGHIYPTSGSEVSTYEKKEEESYYKILCDISAGVLCKDEIEGNSNTYEVISVLPRMTGENPHKEILLKLRK